MNGERHDALYSQARRVLNHDVKRLFFKINPFLERKETLKSRPEQESKFVQLLQSTVLCENYDIGDHVNETARDAKEVYAGDFWDYLYSDDWSTGCALRILEGHLLDEILNNLFVLHKEKKICKHKTFAFARNKRERRGCYKLANQKGCGEIEETLLIEFTYYGANMTPIRIQPSTFSSYPETTTSGTISKRSSSEYSSDNIIKGVSTKRMITKSYIGGRPSGTLPPISRIGSQKSVETNNITEEPESQGTNPMQIPECDSTLQPIEIIPVATSQEGASSQVSTESDYRIKLPELNLEKFPCTEKIKYDDGLDVISEEFVDEEVSEIPGEELYLSDSIIKVAKERESTLTKLRKNKEELNKKRADLKLRQKIASSHRQSLPEMPDFDIDKIQLNLDPSRPKFKFRFLMTKVPKFEELLYLVDSDDMYDPRFRYAKQLGKKIPKRYNLSKDVLSSRALELSELNTNIKKRFAILNNLNTFLRKETKAATKTRNLKTTNAKADSIPINVKGKPYNESKKNDDQFAAEVGGVTDSKECEKHVRNQKDRKLSVLHEATRRKGLQRIRKGNIPSVILTSPSGNISELCDVVTIPHLKSKSVRHLQRQALKKDSDTQESNPESDQEKCETDDDDDQNVFSSFDTSRLNFRYSFERLKGKNYHKKKPAFYEILRKYYRAQKTIDALKASPFLSPLSNDKGKKRKSIFQRILDGKTTKPGYKMVIGEIKHFQFLQYKAKAKVEWNEEIHFHRSENFRQRLVKSLDDFVVRKEHVVSDYCGKTSTTVTFTRKTVFNRK